MTASHPPKQVGRAWCSVLILWFTACRDGPTIDPAPSVGPSVVPDGMRERLNRGERALFDGRTLDGWTVSSFGGEGEVSVKDGALVLDFGFPLTGLTWGGAELPTEDYELEVVAARLEGTDFFCGLSFPVGDSHATLIVGGWGGSLVGLSCIDQADASQNETTSYHRFEQGRDYQVRVRVDRERVQCWLEDEVVVDVPREGHTFQLRPEVLLSRPLGLAAFTTRARVRSIQLRLVAPGT